MVCVGDGGDGACGVCDDVFCYSDYLGLRGAGLDWIGLDWNGLGCGSWGLVCWLAGWLAS